MNTDPLLSQPKGPGSRTEVIVVVGVTAAVIGAAVAGWFYFVASPRPELASVEWSFQYPNGSLLYFGLSANGCKGCPIYSTPAQVISTNVSVTNSDPGEPHDITAAQWVSSAYTIVGIQPNLPVRVPQNSTVILTFELRSPTQAGTYQLSGFLYAD